MNPVAAFSTRFDKFDNGTWIGYAHFKTDKTDTSFQTEPWDNYESALYAVLAFLKRKLEQHQSAIEVINFNTETTK